MAFRIEMENIAKFRSQMCHEPGLCQLKHLFKMTTYVLLLVWDSLIKFLYKQSNNDWNQSFAWIFHYRSKVNVLEGWKLPKYFESSL
jgi:hypothetical protein